MSSALIALVVLNNPADAQVDSAKEVAAECHRCAHAREVPGDAHIQCVKPDPDMRGLRHGIERGWFMYPLLFDPVWKSKRCANYECAESVSHAVSLPVSRAAQ